MIHFLVFCVLYADQESVVTMVPFIVLFVFCVDEENVYSDTDSFSSFLRVVC